MEREADEALLLERVDELRPAVLLRFVLPFLTALPLREALLLRAVVLPFWAELLRATRDRPEEAERLPAEEADAPREAPVLDPPRRELANVLPPFGVSRPLPVTPDPPRGPQVQPRPWLSWCQP